MRSIDELFTELVRLNVKLWGENGDLRYKAPQGVLTPALRAELGQRKAEILTLLQKTEPLPQVIPAPEQRNLPFPLTDVQYAYWVGRNAAFALGNIATHNYNEFEFADLEIEKLNWGWQQLIARHDMLRMVVQPDGQQRILQQVPSYKITVLDLRGQGEAAVQTQLAAIRAEMSHQVFAPDVWPLFDIRATLLDEQPHPKGTRHRVRLHISLELMLVDISSVQRLMGEWGQFYQQPRPEARPMGTRPEAQALPALELSFRDYVVAAEQLKTTERYRRSEAYWLRRVDTLPPAPDLPMVQRLDQITKPQFKRRANQLPAAQWQALKQKASQAGLTPSETLLTVFADVLQAWSRNPRFTLNVTLFHRLPIHPQVDEIIGDFTGINLLEIDHTQPGSFVERGKRIQQQLWQDLDHRYFSGIRVLRALARHRENSGGALMPVVFTSALALGAESKGEFGQAIYGISQTSQVWLDHQVMEQAGALHVNWDAVDELFPVGLLDDMFTSYCACLERLARDDAAWTTPEHALLPPAQAAQRTAVNATTAPVVEELLHTLFLQQVAVQGMAVAVITPECTLTYQALYQRANQIGHWLRARGATPNTLVAVVMTKGWEQVVGVLGVLMAGAAYLPIDPDLPTERQHYLLTQGEVKFALTQTALVERLTWPTGIECLSVDSQGIEEALPPLTPVQTPTDLAYVIYTSGSTGLPKGVAIDHRGAVNTVLDINRRFSVTAQDRVLALSALNFDLSVYDIFGLLAAGGCIVLPSAALRTDPAHWLELLIRHDVTLWNTVPALMQMLVEYVGGASERQDDKVTGRQGDKVNGFLPPPNLPQSGGGTDGSSASSLLPPQAGEGWGGVSKSLPPYLPTPSLPHSPTPLRLLLLSGDWIPVTLPDQVRTLWPTSRVISLGGATEASIWSIYYPIDTVDPNWTSIPYGQPLTNQTFHVLDDHLNPRPLWVPGHLYIGGIGLAKAYWRDPAKTAERFIRHPQTGERLYQTGDLGRYLPAPAGGGGLPGANIEFLGRADFQVKIRGHRIELGEIEATLLQHPGVKEAVVNAVGDPKGARQLIAYLVPVEEPPTEAASLFVVDAADETAASAHWTSSLLAGARCAGAQTQQDALAHGHQTAAFWQYSNQLYLDAICRLFAGFGLFQNAGTRHTLDEVMTQTGSAPRYRKWMHRALQALVVNGWLQEQEGPEDSPFVCLLPAPAPSLALTAPGPDAVSQQPGVAWLLRSAEHLTEVLTERLHSAQLYAADEVPAVYQQGFHQANAVVAAVVEAFVGQQQGPLRILEVGAGYGSTTHGLLPILPAERTTYQFTDISQFFLQRAQTEFAAYPFLQVGLLDLEAPPASQGYELHTYDLILAASVLHVPRRVAETLQHVRSLLAPGGLLVMIEETHFQPAFDLSMGLQQGFERFEDLELRPLHPLLTSAQWQHALQAAGFTQSAVAPPRPEGTHAQGTPAQPLGIDVLIAQGPLVVKRFAPDRLHAYLANKLPDYMLPASYVPLTVLPLTPNGKVDRKALPAVGNSSAPSARPLRNFVAPRTVTEQQLAAIWRAVLQVDPIGIHENFFAVGGDSLLATQVLARLRQTFQVEIPLSDLFKQPTIAQLAALVEAQELAMAETETLEAILAEIGEA